jgi:DNA invertase Pin-like site-specific DNA recombinase
MKIALYARVSTSDQNCEMQLRELRDYAAARKWTIHAEYVDTGWSGTKTNRQVHAGAPMTSPCSTRVCLGAP